MNNEHKEIMELKHEPEPYSNYLTFSLGVATIATWRCAMHTVGVKELKNKLTYYLGLAKGGDNIIVTDRGKPVAILHNLDTIEKGASLEEKLASLAKQGKIRLPLKKGKMKPFKPIKIKGKPLSETIIEERR